MSVSIEKIGRRHYIRAGYQHKAALKAAGCKWDADRCCWWTGKADTAAALVAKLSATVEAAPEHQTEILASDAREIIGRGTYRGRNCYVLGRIVSRARSAYDHDEIAPVKTRDGARIKLTSRDGARIWWAPTEEVSVDKRYQRLTSIQSLRDYAQQARDNGGFVPRRGVDYCGHACPVDGHTCTADRPCHDCQ